ncbi:MAG: glucosyltransferase domain-containing protein [Butyrivibrio sp.]|nr:glucosyltransferase domain-containing protein [Butyrivibrio sp.]
MTKLFEDIKWFLRQKTYIILLSLTAACSYGYAIVQPIIGIDDTAVNLYLEDGLEVVMGRWTIFLLNKMFHVSDFAPFMPELVGVIFLMVAATLFNILLRRLTNNKAGVLVSTIFACVFISNPIISEVFIYYYHDGVGFGYIMTALSLLAFYDGINKKGRQKKILSFLTSLLCIWVAVGCYESFLILYILGILVVIFLWGMTEDSGGYRLRAVLGYLMTGAVITVLCVLLRSVMISLMTQIFGLHGVLEKVRQERRSLSEVLLLFKDGGMDYLIMLVKRFWIVYHVNALVYLPVTIYEFAVFCFGLGSVILAVKKRSPWYPVLFVGMLVTPFLLTLAEMHVTYYRSCQYLPFFAAAGVWLLCYGLTQWKHYGRWITGIMLLLSIIIVWNQAEHMNRNFYMDYKKYETTKEMLCEIAYEIERDYGTDTPVIFTGHYNTPYALTEDYYVSYGSWQYRWIVLLTDWLDPHLKEKYYSQWGYSFIGEANYSMIQWAFDAFDGTNRQMMNFLKMHGHSFPMVTDLEIIEKANKVGDNLPSWPAEGSVIQWDGYILVHI